PRHPRPPRELELDAPFGGQSAQRFGQHLELLAEVGPALLDPSRGMDLCREVEVVDRAEQRARLADNVARALAVAAVGGAEILAIDDLGEADDRVQRSLDLV